MYGWTIYGALVVAVLAPTASLVFLAVRALQAWRDLKRARRHLFRDLDKVFEKLATMADKIAVAADTSTLQARVESLRASLAKLAILREAWVDATRFTEWIPSK